MKRLKRAFRRFVEQLEKEQSMWIGLGGGYYE